MVEVIARDEFTVAPLEAERGSPARRELPITDPSLHVPSLSRALQLGPGRIKPREESANDVTVLRGEASVGAIDQDWSPSIEDPIDPDRVAALLDELERYYYASADHVILSLLWTCSLRIGGLRALDVKDAHLCDRWIDMNHRPESETPLKNKSGSEREFNLHGWVCDLLRAWIDDRPSVTDKHGRKPLLASKQGRMSESVMRVRVYKLTACGDLGEGCACGSAYPSKCDDVVSPHDIRRSSISAWLDERHDPNVLSGRVDTSTRTMEKHYDVKSESQKRKLRRNAFDL